MGKVYRDPENPSRYLFIHDAEPQLDRSPTPDEGEILRVDMAHREVYALGSWIRCQNCGTTVERAEPHPWAFVHLYGDEEWSHGTFKRAPFCDAECWARWACNR